MSKKNRSAEGNPSGDNSKRSAALPSVALSREERVWSFRFINLLIISTMIRVIFAALAELKYEEAYYWMYSQHLSWSYFDHPPLIGWLIYLSTSLMDNGELWVRMPAILCFAGTLFFIHRLACDLFGPRAGFMTALLATCLPAFEFYSILSLPDAPLLLFWSAALCFGYRLYEDERPWWWLAIGAATGLAMLSKYPGVLAPLAPILVIILKKKYQLFKCWQFPVAVVLALAIFSPVLYWNAQHQWASFIFQGLGRFAEANSWLDIVGGSLLCLTALPTPLGFFFLLWVAWQSLKRLQDERWLYLVCSFLPFMAIIALVGTVRLIQLNWPLPIYPALIIATAQLLEELRAWSQRKWQILLGLVFIPALALSLVPWMAVFFELTPLNRYNEIYGWKPMGETASEMLNTSYDPRRCFLVGHGYQTASELAYYTHQPQITLSFNAIGRHAKGYDYWYQAGQFKGWNCVYVVSERLKSDGSYQATQDFKLDELRPYFREIEKSDRRLTIFRGGKPVRRYRFYYCYDYVGLPQQQGEVPDSQVVEELLPDSAPQAS